MTQNYKLLNIKGIKCQNCVNNIINDLKLCEEIQDISYDEKLYKFKIYLKNEIDIKDLENYLRNDYKIINMSSKNKKIIDSVRKFYPLFLITSYIILTSLLLNINNFQTSNFMLDYMGIFFVVFSFFKFLSFKKFVNSFVLYDPIAKKFKIYAFTYPFIETMLGFNFLYRSFTSISLIITIIILLINCIGVFNTIKNKSKINCACLGSIFNLPITKITLIENTVMILMSILMLFSF